VTGGEPDEIGDSIMEKEEKYKNKK